MLKLRKFVDCKIYKSPWNRWEHGTGLFSGLWNSFRFNSVTISDCQAFSTFEPNQNRRGEAIACLSSEDSFILHIKVMLGID